MSWASLGETRARKRGTVCRIGDKNTKNTEAINIKGRSKTTESRKVRRTEVIKINPLAYSSQAHLLTNMATI